MNEYKASRGMDFVFYGWHNVTFDINIINCVVKRTHQCDFIVNLFRLNLHFLDLNHPIPW